MSNTLSENDVIKKRQYEQCILHGTSCKLVRFTMYFLTPAKRDAFLSFLLCRDPLDPNVSIGLVRKLARDLDRFVVSMLLLTGETRMLSASASSASSLCGLRLWRSVALSFFMARQRSHVASWRG